MPFSRRRYAYVTFIAFALTTFCYLFPSQAPTSPQFNHSNSTDSDLKRIENKYAYATFLGPPTFQASNNTDPTQDPYFTSVRLLTYQLLQASATRSASSPPIPFLVLVLPSVPRSQTAILEKEGAIIIPIQPLELPEAFDRNFIENSRFRDVLAKLRLWQLTDYEKVLYIDADTILLFSMDTIFTDPKISTPMKTLPQNDSDAQSQLPPPDSYLMSASADTYGNQSTWETSDHILYLCACFMLFAPSTQLFNYYISVLTSPEAPSNAAYPEQDLLIYVHRKEGRMPWRRIPIEWSANDGGMVEILDGRVKSLHVKGWEGAEGGNVGDENVREMWKGKVREMNEYYHDI